jgi:hypothetical protein
MIPFALMEMTDLHHWIRHLKQRCGKGPSPMCEILGNTCGALDFTRGIFAEDARSRCGLKKLTGLR